MLRTDFEPAAPDGRTLNRRRPGDGDVFQRQIRECHKALSRAIAVGSVRRDARGSSPETNKSARIEF